MITDISAQYAIHSTITQLSQDLNRLFTIVRTIQHKTGGHTHTGEGNEGPLLGSSAIDWPLLAPAGTVSAPSYSWLSDLDSGWYRIALRNFGFTINGTKLLDLSSGMFALTGAATISSTLQVTGLTTLVPQNALAFSHATAEIIPGATSLTFRNNADNASNMVIADAGSVTFRAGLSGITTLGLSGVLTSTNTTDATSINSGSIITDGGVGIEKALWVGGLTNIAGAVTMQSTLAVTSTVTVTGGTITTGTTGDLSLINSGANLLVMSSTGSTQVFAGNYTRIATGGDNTLPGYSFTGDTDSGLYRIGANNLGVAVNATKILDVATTGLSVTGTLTASGAINTDSTTESTSATTGSIQTDGGIGVTKNVFIGGTLLMEAVPAQPATYPGTILVGDSGVNGPQATGGVEFVVNGGAGSGYGFKEFTSDSGGLWGLARRWNSATWTTAMSMTGTDGVLTIASLAGVGTRNVVVDANGKLSAP